MKIKSIDTNYKGYKFRSRLEARWAVFFDSLNIEWEYEKEGFEFEDGTRYLPDFWLPQVNMWAEVKPDWISPEEYNKAEMLVKGIGNGLIILDGIPEARSYSSIILNKDGTINTHNDYVLSSYHNYPQNENRFYSIPSPEDWECGQFNDTLRAINKAKSARFEFGENNG